MNIEPELPLWEVFIQEEHDGSPHVHVGSIHAADSEMALANARDVFARRGKVISVWVVRSEQIVASAPEDRENRIPCQRTGRR